MRRTTPEDWRELTRLIGGFRLSQAIGVFARLGLADQLAGGPRGVEELAEACVASPEGLYRLLRALGAAGVVHELPGRTFELSPMGALLRSAVPGSLRDHAMLYTGEAVWRAWGALEHGVRAGGGTFAHVHGQDVWAWRAAHPEDGAVFDRAMSAMTRLIGGLLDACQLDRFTELVDVGGGQGVLLARALARHPGLRGVLFDRPGVPEVGALVAAGVAERCRVVEGDFRVEIPAGDAILLKHVLHNWEDDEASLILDNARRALRPGGRVLVVERLVEGPGEGLDLKLMDLHMLLVPGGRERTLEEVTGLLAGAGLQVVRVAEMVVEARAIS